MEPDKPSLSRKAPVTKKVRRRRVDHPPSPSPVSPDEVITLPVARPAITNWLGLDELTLVFRQLPPVQSVLCARVCVSWRSLSLAQRHGVVLRHESNQITQGALCKLLGLTPDRAKMLQYERRRRFGGGCFNVFRLSCALTALLENEGSWLQILEHQRSVAAADEKRAKLESRRREAVAKRIARLESALKMRAEWQYGSIAEWQAALSARGVDTYFWRCMKLDAFMGPKLKAPSLKETLAAVLKHELFHSAEVMDAKHAARRVELDAELARLGLVRRADCRLCDAYVRGHPIGVWSTPPIIAREAALMRWLHEYTEYQQIKRRRVEQLRDCYGHYFDGIQSLARNLAKVKFPPPEVWPWLSATGGVAAD